MDSSSISNSSIISGRSLDDITGSGVGVRPLAASQRWLVNSSAASSTSSTDGSTDSSSMCSSGLRLQIVDASALLKKQLT
jgi:hypothetical protein